MKVVFQSYRDGEVRVVDVPEPALQPGRVLVSNQRSLISAGTERSMLEMGRKSIVGKAAERPDLVRKVLDKARRDGIGPTMRSVRERLDKPVPLGYSSAGTVVRVGEGVEPFAVGDLVACAGAGYASHAEVVSVPRNLCATIPAEQIAEASGDDPFEAGAFTTLGAIALQGVRVSAVRVGEHVAVLGLGLVGLLTVQILKAAGCQVIGFDPRAERASLAGELGCDGISSTAGQMSILADRVTSGKGVDAVLLTAATSSNQPVELAADLCRDRGVVVVVGSVGLDVPREPYYEKELNLRFSRSSGPGRYDPQYEEEGVDYPYGYVRWTERRNMAAFLRLLADGEVRVSPLISHRYRVEDAPQAYQALTDEDSVAILLEYSQKVCSGREQQLLDLREEDRKHVVGRGRDRLRVATIGAGRFAGSVLLPALESMKRVELRTVCTATGLSARNSADRFGFARATTDPDSVFGDPDVDAVIVATRHNLHASLVLRAVEADKPVFCEKPLCIREQELKTLIERLGTQTAGREGHRPLVMVGYNRRFAPLTGEVCHAVGETDGRINVTYRVQAGEPPEDHWVLDPQIGGGRIVGEVCHFVDWIQHVAGAAPGVVYACSVARPGMSDEDVTIILKMADGSVGTIEYRTAGDETAGKERIEVAAGRTTAVIEDFRQGRVFTDGDSRRLNRLLVPVQDKGHEQELEAFVDAAMDGQPSPVPLEEALLASAATFAVQKSLRTGEPVDVRFPGG